MTLTAWKLISVYSISELHVDVVYLGWFSPIFSIHLASIYVIRSVFGFICCVLVL